MIKKQQGIGLVNGGGEKNHLMFKEKIDLLESLLYYCDFKKHPTINNTILFIITHKLDGNYEMSTSCHFHFLIDLVFSSKNQRDMLKNLSLSIWGKNYNNNQYRTIKVSDIEILLSKTDKKIKKEEIKVFMESVDLENKFYLYFLHKFFDY
jgi:hypothetical protein